MSKHNKTYLIRKRFIYCVFRSYVKLIKTTIKLKYAKFKSEFKERFEFIV